MRTFRRNFPGLCLLVMVLLPSACKKSPGLSEIFREGSSKSDNVAPLVVSATAEAGTSMILVEFTEPVYTNSSGIGNLVLSDFGYTDNNALGATSIASLSDANGGDKFITITTNAVINTGDSVDELVFNANEIFDAAGNSLEAISKPLVISAIPPVLTGAETMDMDSNGQIDHVKLTFSKNVKDSTFPNFAGNNNIGTATTNWVIAGYSNVKIDTRDALPPSGPGDTVTDDNVIYLIFDESGSYDTAAKPDITAAAPGLQNLGGATVNPVVSGSISETDGAPAVMYDATEKAGEKDLVVSFSEPVYTNNNGSGALVSTDFTYTDGNTAGAASISSLADANGSDSSITLQMNAFFVVGDENTDQLSINSNEIYDAVGLAAISCRIGGTGYCQITHIRTRITSGTAPNLLSAETMDIDCNGKIDHYKLTFDTPVNTTTIAGYNGTNAIGSSNATGWAVAGHANVKVDTRDNGPSCGAGGSGSASRGPADTDNADAVLYLTFDENSSPCTVFSGSIGNDFSGCDTGTKPELTYTLPGSDPRLKDFDPTLFASLAAGGVAESDKALPILANAKAAEGKNTLNVNFSEAVYTNTGMSGALATADFTYTDTNTAGAGSLSSITHTAGASSLVLTLNQNFLLADNNQDILTIAASQIHDAADNAATGNFTIRAVPRLTATETLDCDADGKLDHLKLTFSSAVTDSTFPGYALNALGGSQTAWLVTGYSGILLQHGTSVNTACAVTDTVNDAVLYLTFTESGYDTGAKPDVTNSGDAVLAGTSGSESMFPIVTAEVSKTDKAAPRLVTATTTTGSTDVLVQFSEAVYTNTGSSGNLVMADFSFTDGNAGAGMTAISSLSDADGSDKAVHFTMNTAAVSGDHNMDSISVVAGQIFDAADIAAVAQSKTITLGVSDLGNNTIFDPTNNLVWMKCAHGRNNDATCSDDTGVSDTVQYCTTQTNACDGGNGTAATSGPAFDACNSLNSNPPGGFAGRTNWRMPTQTELMTLVYCSNGTPTPLAAGDNCGSGYTSPTINTTLFPNTSANEFWTSIANTSLGAKYVTFATGLTPSSGGKLKDSFVRLRCVATGP